MRTATLSCFLPVLLVFLPLATLSQGNLKLLRAEKELQEIFSGIREAGTDSSEIAQSLGFQEMLKLALSLPGSYSYSWDSLKHIAKLTSPDNKFRIYNWNLPLHAGGNRYFAILQFKDSPKSKPPVILKDFSDSITEPSTFTGDSLHWPGALYYKIIPFESSPGKISYILFGWDGLSKDISSKVIEVLSFEGPAPVFGLPVFHGYKESKEKRVIFRFSSTATMSLKYQVQKIPSKPEWNSRKKEYETIEKSGLMIIFDHLMPMDPQLEGQYRFYVPAAETAEGFVYGKYSWNYVKEFDALNP